jgi:tetratricopeptide (TPR) repeat protein
MQPRAEAFPVPAADAPIESRADVLRTLFERDFATLTRLIEQRQADLESDIRREGDLARITGAFRTADPAVAALLDEWIEAEPSSYAARLARAEQRVVLAWERRGNRYAKDTSEEQFRGMAEALTGVAADAQAVLTRNPRVVEAYRLWIRAAMGLGRPDGCARIAGQGLSLVPASMRVRVAVVQCFRPRWGGSYELMDVVANEADQHVAVNPALASLHGFVAWDRATLETDPDRRLDLFKRALAQGEYWLFYYDRGRTLFEQARYREALEDANRALALEPDDSDTLVLRAKALTRLGQAQAATKDLQFVALIDPTNTDLRGVIRNGRLAH